MNKHTHTYIYQILAPMNSELKLEIINEICYVCPQIKRYKKFIINNLLKKHEQKKTLYYLQMMNINSQKYYKDIFGLVFKTKTDESEEYDIVGCIYKNIASISNTDTMRNYIIGNLHMIKKLTI